MVFYRKYRPQSLDELLGQVHIKSALKNAFDSDKLAHAYLFSGPRGLGKTSTARILAKMVNCESPNPQPPCNKCESCLSITDGSNLDLIEIDAASNRGIDDIRELRERIKLAPTQAKKKVYIIDEVHMLTTEAFNALLKTLEEPPAHVLFILATTEPQKVPQTILSRVQKLDFHLAKPKELFEALEKVVKAEKIQADQEALKLISKKAEGSFRDGLKLLDQLASSSDKITIVSINQALKSGSLEDQLTLLGFISEKDPKKALKYLTETSEKGLNVKEFLNSLLNTLRTMVLIKNEVVEDEDLTQITNEFTQENLIKLINHLLKAQEQLKFASIPNLPLEIAILESITPHVVLASEARPESAPTTPVILGSTTPPESSSIPQISSEQSDSPDILVIKDKWNYILETIRPYNYSLEALLKQAKVISCDGVMVILEVPYSFHQRILDAPKSKSLLESVLADVLGKEVKVSTVLGSRPNKIEELANVELAQDDEIIKIASEIFNS